MLPWQARCYPAAASVEEVEPFEGEYTDRTGVVWQGQRWGEEAEGADADDE